MQTRSSVPLWATWLCWIGVSIVVWVAAAFVSKFASQSVEGSSFLDFVFSAIVGTLILACAQSIVLAPYLVSRRRWIGNSMLAVVWGTFTALAVGTLVLFTMLPFTLDDPPAFAFFNIFSVSFLCAGASGGACIGHLQRECFKGSVGDGRRWVASWTVGAGLAMFLYIPWSPNTLHNGIVCGVVFGIVTGFALISVLKTPPAPHRDQNSLHDASQMI